MKSIDALKYAGWVHTIGFVSSDPPEGGNVAMSFLRKAAFLRGILIGSRHQYVLPF